MVIGSGVLGLTRRPTRILRSERWSGPPASRFPSLLGLWPCPASRRWRVRDARPMGTDMTAAPPTSSAVYESGPLWAGRNGDWVLHQSQPSGWGTAKTAASGLPSAKVRACSFGHSSTMLLVGSRVVHLWLPDYLGITSVHASPIYRRIASTSTMTFRCLTCRPASGRSCRAGRRTPCR